MQRKEEEEEEEEMKSTNGEGEIRPRRRKRNSAGGKVSRKENAFMAARFRKSSKHPQKWGGTRQSGDFLPKQVVHDVGDKKRVTFPCLFL